jgi:hypothetical protein
MLTVSIQVYEGSEKIGSCTGMLGNTYTQRMRTQIYQKNVFNHTHCPCGKFYPLISILPNASLPLSALSWLLWVSNLITWSTTSSMKGNSAEEDFSSANTGTWWIWSLPGNAAAAYLLFKPPLRDKERSIRKDCRLWGMLTPFSPQKSGPLPCNEPSRNHC